jgi:hypothetical protein
MAKFTEERGRGGACLHSECPRPASGLPFPHGPAPPLVAAESRPVRQRSALRRREVRAGPTALISVSSVKAGAQDPVGDSSCRFLSRSIAMRACQADRWFRS